MSERKVSTDALETLGMIIDDTQKRDAIRLAVAPVRSVQRLMPGDHITITDGRASKARVNEGHGIVDPFLEGPVRPGEVFWFVMYPRKVTSLRHVWSHPDFPDEADVAAPEQSTRSESETWMRAWAVRHMGENHYGDELLSEEEAYQNAINAGRNNHLGPYEGADSSINGVWWDHWEAITGAKGDRETYFSCSC